MQIDTMNIVAGLMFATGKATTIKEAVHMAAQIGESVEARVLKDMPDWAKSAKKALDESNAKVAEVATEEE